MKILLPVDRSAASLQAARLLADYRGDRARIVPVLLNVQHPVLKAWPGHGIDPAAIEAALREKAMEELSAAQELLAGAGFAPERLVRLGHASSAILEEAQRLDVGAIVMGTRGRGALGGYALGSVALRVAQSSERPVVLVRPESRLPASLGREARVVVPVDGSDEAAAVAERVSRCADVLGRLHIDVVHFRDPATEADEAIARTSEALRASGVEHDLHVLVGDPASGIAQFASDRAADLVAMSTRGRGALHHALIGSVALKTAHLSPVPVALLR